MRLGDLDALKSYLKDMNVDGGHAYYRKGVQDAINVFFPQFIDDQPTIDPETLPIVRQLREELARVTAERDAAMSFIPKIRDTCKYKDTPCDWCMYDPDGLDNWEWDGLPKQTKQNTGDQNAEI